MFSDSLSRTKCIGCEKSKTNLSMQAFYRRFSGGFFYFLRIKKAPCAKSATRGLVGEELSPFINHPIYD
ncbi:hypothetical protein ROD_14971 [Citrobacter rodentium ICC168]|uniref:Uncharacterized protein n=1 Tax=Citrobacter rodentium (strain ICC168) TaxID=637910 RepID=D2TID4_CITRI|nr:hypothetical protein ROD_14971 [Citrobacter rodentium ICC168]